VELFCPRKKEAPAKAPVKAAPTPAKAAPATNKKAGKAAKPAKKQKVNLRLGATDFKIAPKQWTFPKKAGAGKKQVIEMAVHAAGLEKYKHFF